jgi:hypothetical protein
MLGAYGCKDLWLMPLLNLHLTTLEMAHSLTQPELAAIIQQIDRDSLINMTDYTYDHRARLIKPLVSYDGSALALSFLPAAGEGLDSETVSNLYSSLVSKERSKEDDTYTYHHLRRDLLNLVQETGVNCDQRYVVPSAHITLARFLVQEDHNTKEKMEVWIKKIEDINEWLEREHWPNERSKGTEWVVGQDKGLDCREGQLWYGGGNTIRLGKEF